MRTITLFILMLSVMQSTAQRIPSGHQLIGRDSIAIIYRDANGRATIVRRKIVPYKIYGADSSYVEYDAESGECIGGGSGKRNMIQGIDSNDFRNLASVKCCDMSFTHVPQIIMRPDSSIIIRGDTITAIKALWKEIEIRDAEAGKNYDILYKQYMKAYNLAKSLGKLNQEIYNNAIKALNSLKH